MRAEVVWWNVQRLFAPRPSSLARRVAGPDLAWGANAHAAKVDAIAGALRHLLRGRAPALVALGEVENGAVVRDLLAALRMPELVEAVVPDEWLEGYDVALLYSRTLFPGAPRARSFNVQSRLRTRDVLEVELRCVTGDRLVVLVNHWPSRLVPEAESYRLALASRVAARIDELLKIDARELRRAEPRDALLQRERLRRRWQQRVLVLGDFNDDPFARSIAQVLDATRQREAAAPPAALSGDGPIDLDRYLSLRARLHNPTWQLLTRPRPPLGTCWFGGEWYLFDQVLLSPALLGAGGLQYVEGSLRIGVRAGNGKSLLTAAGHPAPFQPRSRSGASDHLPLLLSLELDPVPARRSPRGLAGAAARVSRSVTGSVRPKSAAPAQPRCERPAPRGRRASPLAWAHRRTRRLAERVRVPSDLREQLAQGPDETPGARSNRRR